MHEIPIRKPVSAELEQLRDLGSPDEVQATQELDLGGFYARLGDQPIAHNLRSISQRAGVQVDSTIYQRFEVWLVPHRVSVIRRSGAAEPVTLGIEIEYETKNATCAVASLLPAPEYVVRGEIGTRIRCTGRFSASGEAMNNADSAISGPKLEYGSLSVGISAGGVLGFDWGSTVATARIQAVGVGSSKCEWQFNRDKEPLHGRDIETWSTLVLPRGRRTLRYRARFYFVARTLFIPTRRESEWQTLDCTLECV